MVENVLRIRGSERVARLHRLVAASVAACTAAGVLAVILEATWLRLLAAIVALGGAIAAVALVAVVSARSGREWIEQRLRVRVRPIKDVDAYAVGVDREAVETWRYVPRTYDPELRQAVQTAARTNSATLIVLRAPSKAGKSRSLFQAALDTVPNALMIAPVDAAAAGEVIHGTVPRLRRSVPVLVWLDDLEDFVQLGSQGFGPNSLEQLRSWKRPVIVLATQGGKGLRRLSDDAKRTLADPLDRVLDAAAYEISLRPALSRDEQRSAARLGYSHRDVEAMAEGLGEYMIAARRLERRLDRGDEECPEGAAIVWTAIDWQRSGLSAPVSDELLNELYGNYLPSEPTGAAFERGLNWATEPLYASHALLRTVNSYRAHDYVVAYAERKLEREINRDTWRYIVSTAEDAQAYNAGLVAYAWHDYELAAIAWRQAAMSEDATIAGPATFNLGYLLQEEGDLAGAERAWRRADDLGSAAAAFTLGVLYYERDEASAATAAWRRAAELGLRKAEILARVVDSPRSETVDDAIREAGEAGDASTLLNLGLVLEHTGDVEGAVNAWQEAADCEPAQIAAVAALSLGALFIDLDQPDDARDAFVRAQQLGDPDVSRDASDALLRLSDR
jgi:tetratricopeptide (TPR) repeat protein